MSEVTWVISDQLAGGRRPRYNNGLREVVSEPVVAAWCDSVREAGIGSILCLLAPEHLELYAGLPIGLVDYYLMRGFNVIHVPVADHKNPPLDVAELDKAWKAFCDLPKPVLVHCSAGVDRSGAAIEHILAKHRVGGSRDRQSPTGDRPLRGDRSSPR
jgi:polymorphic toxin system DSP-PTPase phosphatase-like protein